ncbi:MAG: hypothetical protein Athens071416_502 [Parcubacteria group bacterium Athens0714_16]|nr:MAG: hypothetical protein Athens071416_502 [Parcubacteria group bacterium Athens0714_16]
MKKEWNLFLFFVWLLIFSTIMCSIYSNTVGIQHGFEVGFATLLFIIPVVLIIFCGIKIYDDWTKKCHRIKLYGKYLKVAGLSEDIKDILGHFILLEEKEGDTSWKNIYKVYKYSFSQNLNLLILYLYDQNNDDRSIDIYSDKIEYSWKEGPEKEFYLKYSIKLLF